MTLNQDPDAGATHERVVAALGRYVALFAVVVGWLTLLLVVTAVFASTRGHWLLVVQLTLVTAVLAAGTLMGDHGHRRWKERRETEGAALFFASVVMALSVLVLVVSRWLLDTGIGDMTVVIPLGALMIVFGVGPFAVELVRASTGSCATRRT